MARMHWCHSVVAMVAGFEPTHITTGESDSMGTSNVSDLSCTSEPPSQWYGRGCRALKCAATIVSLSVEDSTVKFVVTEILRQAHLRPLYNTSTPAFAKRITVKIHHENAMNAIATALKGTGLTANMAPDGETVVIRERSTFWIVIRDALASR